MNLRRTAAVAVSVSALTLIPLSPAGASTAVSGLNSFDKQLLADLNAARIQRGISPLDLSNRLTPIATQWAQQISTRANATDNPHLRADLNAVCPAWRKVGENVGVAGESSADDLFAVYMNNSGDRKTMLNPTFTWVGVHSDATSEDGAPEEWSVLDFANHCS
jgi:uncharacterized protein YkwD